MDKLERIKQELEKHYGSKNVMSAGIIEDMFGYPKDDTHSNGRRLIKQCAEKYGIPLGSTNDGYYIMTTEEELDEYKANLDSRIEKIKDRKTLMENNYKEWHK